MCLPGRVLGNHGLSLKAEKTSLARHRQALYGVYGTLGLGLLLFCLRAMKPELKWKEKPIWFAFWAINIGLMLEILLSLLPIGLLQTYQSVSVGYWSARSSEFMQTEGMQLVALDADDWRHNIRPWCDRICLFRDRLDVAASWRGFNSRCGIEESGVGL